MNSPKPGPGTTTTRTSNINSNRESPTPQQIVGMSGGHVIARNKQEGAVQAFKIANEAASYLNGNLTDLNSSTQANTSSGGGGGGINVGKNRNIAIPNKRQVNNNM